MSYLYSDMMRDINPLSDELLAKKYHWHAERAEWSEKRLQEHRYQGYYRDVVNHRRIMRKIRRVARRRGIEL